MLQRRTNRRSFLGASAGWLAAGVGLSLEAGERPQIHNPRATDGDSAHEPAWSKRLTITVGPRNTAGSKKADLVGNSDRVLQAAVDYVARMGGGVVRLLPGVFTLRNSVHLPSKIRIVGAGDETVITKGASTISPLAADSDWYDQEITLQDAVGFQVGDGVVLQTKNPHTGAQDTIKRMLVAQSGKRFKLNDGIRKNLWLSGKPTAATLFPLFTSENTHDVILENLTFDGNRQNNANLNGNYGGCIFLQDCNRYTIRNVTTRNYNGDGVSFQICHDVVIENCHSHDNADLGVHPGSGSQRPLIRNCRLERNNIGVFWCWGVKFGLAEGNKISRNRSYGMSIGHNDTDNIMRDNDISESGKVGILFRDDARGADFWANRNLVANNRIINSGGDAGVGIDILGHTKDTKIVGNEIRETRNARQRIGIRINDKAGGVELVRNTIEGFSQDIADARSV